MLLALSLNEVTGAGTASFTYYDSYPKCCPKSPTYDPKASTEECEDYSGCKYIGDFAALGHKSIDYVKSHNLVSFFDSSNPSEAKWEKLYANKIIQITKSYKNKIYIFNSTIADTCADSDCSNCCTKNAGINGFLVDMEYYTVMNNFGTTDAADGTLTFKIF